MCGLRATGGRDEKERLGKQVRYCTLQCVVWIFNFDFDFDLVACIFEIVISVGLLFRFGSV